MTPSEIAIGRSLINPFAIEGKPSVSKVKTTENIKLGILKAVDALGGFNKVIGKGDRVLVKPNYNSADAPPASTDPHFLRAIVELLFEHGAGKVMVGESSWQLLKTRKALSETNALSVLENTGAEVAFLDEGHYVKVDVGGEYLEHVNLSEEAMGFDKLVYSCCMKTHFRADFSLSLKLAFGFTKKTDRIGFHLSHLKEKLVDLNLVVQPNLIIMDGRLCFISGGPFSGEVRAPNLVLASGDRIAIDVEAIKVIAGFENSNLNDTPWNYTQIKHATKLGLGVKSETDYSVIAE